MVASRFPSLEPSLLRYVFLIQRSVWPLHQDRFSNGFFRQLDSGHIRHTDVSEHKIKPVRLTSKAHQCLDTTAISFRTNSIIDCVTFAIRIVQAAVVHSANNAGSGQLITVG